MHPPARLILLTTAAALLGAAGPASAAVTAKVADERLVVTGDSADDIVILSRGEAGSVVVDGAGTSAAFDPATFRAVSIAAGQGDDVVTITAPLDERPIAIAGGEGDDALLGGADAESLDGGPGDDVLDAGAGDDLLTGGDGQDVLTCGDGFDVLLGREPADTAGEDCEGEQPLVPDPSPAREPKPATPAVPDAPPVAGDAGAAPPVEPLTRAEIIAAAVPPGFADPVLRATRSGLMVEVRNTSVTVLNVRINANEVVAGRSYAYRPVFKRLAPGARAKVKLAAPRRLADVLKQRKGVRRAAVANVINAENNAQRTVRRRFR